MLTLKLNEEALSRGMVSIPPDILRAVHTLEASSIIFAIKWGDVWIRSNPQAVIQESTEASTGHASTDFATDFSTEFSAIEKSLLRGAPPKGALPKGVLPKTSHYRTRDRVRSEDIPLIPRGQVWRYVKQHLSKVRVGEKISISLPEGVSFTHLQNKIAAFCGQEWGAGCYATQQHKERGVVEVVRLNPPKGYYWGGYKKGFLPVLPIDGSPPASSLPSGSLPSGSLPDEEK